MDADESRLWQALAQPGLLHAECQDMFAAASPLEGMPPRGAAYLDSSDELDERCARPVTLHSSAIGVGNKGVDTLLRSLFAPHGGADCAAGPPTWTAANSWIGGVLDP